MVSKKFSGNAGIRLGHVQPIVRRKALRYGLLQINFEIWIIGAVKLHAYIWN